MDAPAGDFDWEEEAITPELFRQRVERMKAVGRHRYSTLGIAADGAVVAHTDMVLPAGKPERVLQWCHPERKEIHTTNAEVNEAMVAINDRLGFKPVAVCPGFQRKLTP